MLESGFKRRPFLQFDDKFVHLRNGLEEATKWTGGAVKYALATYNQW
jgi:hypothetical protein